MNRPNTNIPFNPPNTTFQMPVQSNIYVEVFKRQLIETYRDDKLTSIIYPYESCNSGIYNFPVDVQRAIMNILSSRDEYKMARMCDIKFCSNRNDNLMVYIKDKLVMNATEFPVFKYVDYILYRGYYIEKMNSNVISIIRMDNPYNGINYRLQSRKPLDSYATYKYSEHWYDQALDYIDNLTL